MEPLKILDAPGLEDDFYLNLLDWNQENSVAIALYDEIYIQDTQRNESFALSSSRGDNGANTTSIAWCKDKRNPYLSQGLRSSEVRIWDVGCSKVVNTIKQHSD